MPTYWQNTEPGYSIIVWQCTESMEDLKNNISLTAVEESAWNSFKSETRKKEFLTVRHALKVISNLEAITYDSNGKPHLKNGFISISHSHEFIAVMVSNISGIGIDIEIISPRILNLSKKFLSPDEIKNIHIGDPLEKIHVMWGAKEVLYKIHSIGNLIFKENLCVHPFDYSSKGKLSATIQKKGFEETFQIQYEAIKGYMLTWSCRNKS
jgi:4'-phosphopantetheinyl transferase